jgi:hypothetical protein
MEVLRELGDDWQAIEVRIDDGQMEELIAMAESELELIPEYAYERCWEVSEGHRVEIEEHSFNKEFLFHDEPAMREVEAEAGGHDPAPKSEARV